MTSERMGSRPVVGDSGGSGRPAAPTVSPPTARPQAAAICTATGRTPRSERRGGGRVGRVFGGGREGALVEGGRFLFPCASCGEEAAAVRVRMVKAVALRAKALALGAKA